jgi:hypothetical protein
MLLEVAVAEQAAEQAEAETLLVQVGVASCPDEEQSKQIQLDEAEAETWSGVDLSAHQTDQGPEEVPKWLPPEEAGRCL